MGVRDGAHAGDVLLYSYVAQAVAHGSIPYRNLYFEYPPGALVPMLVPEPASSYGRAFKIEMAVLGAALLPLAAVVLRVQRRRLLPALLAIAVSPLALGSVFVNRYDVFPALLLLGGVVLLVRDRPTAAFVLVALGTVAKVYPAAVLPVFGIWVWRTAGREALKRGLVAFAATVAVVVLPFAALGPGGLRFSFTIQMTRHLQTESLGSALLLVADRAGVYHAHIAEGKPGSLDLFGTLPSLVASLSLVAVVAVLLWIPWTLRRGALDRERLLAGVAGAVVAYVALGKVLSPQYLVWLIPLVPLVGKRAGAVATALLLTALVLTQIEFDHAYDELRTVGNVVWVLLARDLVLVALAGVLLAAVRGQPGGSQTSKPPLLTSR